MSINASNESFLDLTDLLNDIIPVYDKIVNGISIMGLEHTLIKTKPINTNNIKNIENIDKDNLDKFLLNIKNENISLEKD